MRLENHYKKVKVQKNKILALTAGLADWHVNQILSDNPWIEDENGDLIYTEEAQDIFNNVHSDIEDMLLVMFDPIAD